MVGVELWPRTAAALPVTAGAATADESAVITYPVPSGDGVTIDHDQQVIVVRFQQRAWAFNLACPHENTALRWKERKGHFQCPRHESEYQPDGTFISGRATRNMDRFAITRDGTTLRVDLDLLYRSDESPAEWSAAVVAL